jgi:hypothetical protein
VPQGRDQRGVVLRLAQEVWGLLPSEMKWLRQLEEENQRLKKLVADLSLDKEMLLNVIRRKYEACPEAGDGRRHPAGLAGQYSARLPGITGRPIDLSLPVQTLRKRIKEIAETRVRYGYRRIHVLLRREGWLVNTKRVCQLYRAMGLQFRNKSPKRRVKAQLCDDRAPATARNQVWAMDFVHDQLFDGRKIRILTVVDTFTRLSPAIECGSNPAALMSLLCSNGLAERSAAQRRFSSITGRNSLARSLICGPSCAALRSTSAGPASRPTMPSSKA